MKTVKEVSRISGVSVRTLHHYDAIGLLKPAQVTEAGYRLYDDSALERLYFILLFRELGFALKDIRGILDAPDFDRNRVLDRQIDLLERKRRHLEYITNMARGVRMIGVKYLEFDGFDVNKIDDYAEQAKTLYGKTDAYREYEEKVKGRTKAQSDAVNAKVMDFLSGWASSGANPPTVRKRRTGCGICRNSSLQTSTPAPRKSSWVWENCMTAAAP